MTINPRIYQALVLAQGLEFYVKTGVPINSAYTPANMMRTAENILSPAKFKRRDYLGAAKALREWVKENENEA